MSELGLVHNPRSRVFYWSTHWDMKTRGHLHRVKRAFGHSLLAPIVGRVFEILNVSIAVHEQGDNWVSIHSGPNLLSFEIEHGADSQRFAYNRRLLALARREKKTLRGEHRGHSDVFAPIVVRGKPVGVLVGGPFSPSPPESARVLAEWLALTGRKGDPSDPEFAAYLAAVLSLPVFEGKKAGHFEELLGCFAELMAGEGDAARLTNRAETLRAELEQARFPERTWRTIRSLIDDRFQRSWHHGLLNELGDLGLSREADHVLVGLTSSRVSEPDPVDETMRRHAFQRAAVDLARSFGDAIAGQLADQGVVFLAGSSGSAQKRRQRALELAERAAVLGRDRFGLAVCFGASPVSRSVPFPRSYEAALAAAESALAQGTKVVVTDLVPKQRAHSLRQLRQGLEKIVEEHPELLSSRFARYLEAVAAESGYRMDAARGHLEAGFERMTDPLLKSGVLDEKSHRTLCAGLEREARPARTLGELFGVYQRGALRLSEAVQKPVRARQDRSLRGALDYIHRHYTEPLTRNQVARIAGFAPSYFSVLFAKHQTTTFERYLSGLRIERAKQLLTDTELDVGRVAELSGFHSSEYFHRAFRRATATTPLQFRRAPPENPKNLRRASAHR